LSTFVSEALICNPILTILRKKLTNNNLLFTKFYNGGSAQKHNKTKPVSMIYFSLQISIEQLFNKNVIFFNNKLVFVPNVSQ